MTSTYGVMAGTLTGLASLAFYENPSEKLRNVALGASLGLYAGILLGAYLVYMVPDPDDGKAAPGSPSTPNPAPQNQDDPLNLGASRGRGSLQTPALAWQPIIGVGPRRGPVLGFALRY